MRASAPTTRNSREHEREQHRRQVHRREERHVGGEREGRRPRGSAPASGNTTAPRKLCSSTVGQADPAEQRDDGVRDRERGDVEPVQAGARARRARATASRSTAAVPVPGDEDAAEHEGDERGDRPADAHVLAERARARRSGGRCPQNTTNETTPRPRRTPPRGAARSTRGIRHWPPDAAAPGRSTTIRSRGTPFVRATAGWAVAAPSSVPAPRVHAGRRRGRPASGCHDRHPPERPAGTSGVGGVEHLEHRALHEARPLVGRARGSRRASRRPRRRPPR